MISLYYIQGQNIARHFEHAQCRLFSQSEESKKGLPELLADKRLTAALTELGVFSITPAVMISTPDQARARLSHHPNAAPAWCAARSLPSPDQPRPHARSLAWRQ